MTSTKSFRYIVASAIGVWAVIIILCAVTYFPIARSKRPHVPVEALLVEDIPESFYLESPSDVTVKTKEDIYGRQLYKAQASKFRSWKSDKATVVQYVYPFDQPVSAAIRYRLHAPGIRGNAPNFEIAEHRSQRYPDDWSFPEADADETQVACAGGTLQACRDWRYWARHGQYIIKVMVRTDGIDVQQLKLFVEPIDKHVGEQLEP